MTTRKMFIEIAKKNKFYVFVTILSGVLPIVNVYILQDFLNQVTSSGNESFGYLNNYVIKYFFLLILSFVCSKLLAYLNEIIQLNVGTELVEKIIISSSHLSLEEFEVSDYQNKIKRVVENSLGSIVGNFSLIISMLSMSLSLAISIVYLSSWNTYVGIVLLIFPFVFYKQYINIIKKSYSIEYQQTEKKKENWYITFLLTQDNAFKENKIFNFLSYLIEIYKCNVESFKTDSKNMFKYDIVMSLLPEISGGMIVIVMMYYIFWKLGSGEIYLGSVVAIIQLAYQVLENSKALSSDIINYQKNSMYVKELIEVLQYFKNNSQIDSDYRVSVLEFQNVDFCKGDKKILKNISFSLNRNFYYIIGPNGSGKTTLLNVISGLYSASSGNIVINGQDSISSNVINFRSSQLFQDFKRYEFSVLENVILGNYSKKYDVELVEKLLIKLSLIDRIRKLDNGLNSILGSWFDKSENLSGGEWQKLAIARTIFKEADIYLFDEPQSMLDTENSRRIIEFIRDYLDDKIVIVTTHKIELLSASDNVIFMKNGTVALIGQHENLLKNAEYREYVRSDKGC